MWGNIYFLLSLLGLGAASYTDIKHRIVPNKLNYSMIAIGVALHLIEAFVKADYGIAYMGVLTVIGTFIFAYGLYRIGFFAGGDVKLFTGIAALNPVNYNVLGQFFGIKELVLGGKIISAMPIGLPIFSLNVLVMSLFAIFPYGFAICIAGILKNRKLKKELMKSLGKAYIELAMLSVVAIASIDALAAASMPGIGIIFIILAFGALKFRAKVIAGIVLGIFGAYVKGFGFLMEAMYIFAPLAILYGVIKLYFVAKDNVLKKTVKITEAEEGMISDEVIYLEGRKVKRLENLGLGMVINCLKANKLGELLKRLRPQNVIVDKGASGLELEQLEKLKKLVKEKKLENSLRTKMSVAFVPAVFIGFLLGSLLGDLIWKIF